jgi:hypothetical protein
MLERPRALLGPAILFLCAAALIAACGDDEEVRPVDPSTSAGGSGGSGAAGGSGGVGGSGGSGGSGGCGDNCMSEQLYVGAAKELINPTIVEGEWTDVIANNHYDPGEPFNDVNANNVFDATWIAGFSSGRPATASNDDLEVRAIAFRHGDTTVVICVLDVIGYFVDEMDRIRADPQVQALDVDHIMIGSTHTHEGVDTVGLWGPNQLTTGLNAEYQALTRERAALAIKGAVEALAPARMRVAQAITADPGGTLNYVNDTRDPIIYDPTLTIAQFTAAEDATTTIATLVNWAAHPEYAGSDNNLLSADYVHWLREVIEVGVPAESVVGIGGTTVFVQGPLGGQVGPGGGVHPIGADGMPILQAGLPRAEAAGTNVAKLALAALAKDGVDVDAADTAITYRETTIDARIDNLGYYFFAEQGIFDRAFYNYDETMPPSPDNPPFARLPLSYLQVGPLATITAPGELHPELWLGGYDGSYSWGQPLLTEPMNQPDMTLAPQGPYLRDLMLSNPGVKYAFVSGLMQDFLGYIVPSFNYVLHATNPYFEEAAGDHYEETNSIGPLVEEHIQHPMMTLATPP